MAREESYGLLPPRGKRADTASRFLYTITPTSETSPDKPCYAHISLRMAMKETVVVMSCFISHQLEKNISSYTSVHVQDAKLCKDPSISPLPFPQATQMLNSINPKLLNQQHLSKRQVKK